MDDKDRGLYDKYKVERTDGSSAPGGKHDGCQYFVLNLTHDPFAADALRTYAISCASQYPALASDLWDMIRTAGKLDAEKLQQARDEEIRRELGRQGNMLSVNVNGRELKAGIFPEGMQSWPDERGMQPRDMSWGYVDTETGRVHVHSGDWLLYDQDGKVESVLKGSPAFPLRGK